jgi:NADH-quinone oxidoreductase subunit E
MLINWLSTELMDKVAEIIQVLPIEVYEVVSLHYVQSKPVGKYLNFVKHPLLPQRNGRLNGLHLWKLGVQLGEITADGLLK